MYDNCIATSSDGRFKKGLVPWHSGKTKETDVRIMTKAIKKIIGRKICSGYVLIYKPNHPNSKRGYIQEHRFIMEQKIGRILFSNEVVHHKNRIRTDNREENLELTNSSDHCRLHVLERDPDWAKRMWANRVKKYGKSGGNTSASSKKGWLLKKEKYGNSIIKKSWETRHRNMCENDRV